MTHLGLRSDALFTAPSRSMVEEDRIALVTVGVDIGSSTSHLLFSRLELEREDTRYVTTRRETLHESDILFTPYLDDVTIDGAALSEFVVEQYAQAGLDRSVVDTGALILTGVALRRRNARVIAELFADEAGRFVSVSAGDNLEATMAAHGSGAVALSLAGAAVLNLDIGGGTTKIATCRDGRVAEVMAVDVGARLIAHDEDLVITRLEDAGCDFAASLGVDVAVGRAVREQDLSQIAEAMIDALLAELATPGGPSAIRRTAPIRDLSGIGAVTVSGGVAEFVHRRAGRSFGDLAPLLAAALRRRAGELPAPLHATPAGIRATVIGASQYTVQVSGSTVYLDPLDVVPLRNLAVVTPDFSWGEQLTGRDVAGAVRLALSRFDLAEGRTPVAIGARWSGTASFARISAFCDGVLDGLRPQVAAGYPIVLVFDGDVGGLVGLHLRDLGIAAPVVSIDGIDLKEFDFIDIGEIIPTSGVVPVVVKSLVFSTSAQQ